MMEYRRNNRLGLDAGATSSGRLGLGMKRENYYRVEAFGPVDLISLRGEFRRLRLPWKQKAERLMNHTPRRNGEIVVPITAVIQAFRKLPEGLNDFLFANKLWQEEFANLVVTAGLNDSLDKHLKGAAYTAAWYVFLTSATPTFAAADIMSSHAGWTEVVAYSEAVRQTLTLGTVAAGSVDNSAAKATFTINADGTAIGGAGVVTVNTKSGTTGTLYGGGAFTGGNKTLSNTDVLQVTITATAT